MPFPALLPLSFTLFRLNVIEKWFRISQAANKVFIPSLKADLSLFLISAILLSQAFEMREGGWLEENLASASAKFGSAAEKEKEWIKPPTAKKMKFN